jgi:hypothetical protein
VSGLIRPRATAHGAWRLAMHDQLTSWLGLSLAARSSRGSGPRRENGERTLVALTVRSPRNTHARWRGGALTGGSVVAGQWHGAAGEVAGATGRAPGKAVRGGAHPNGSAVWRRWRSLGAVAFIGEGRAPVAGGDGGMTLQCRCRRGKVRATSIGDNSGGWEGLIMSGEGGGART